MNKHVSCYESHPPLKIGEYVVYGGSCISPCVHDADIYIGLDLGMGTTDKAYPWEKGIEFLYYIQDRCAPKTPSQFQKMITWIAEQLKEGKKIHIGCIGGHGRTGTVLAALVKEMTGEEDAITYVRKHYCKKAVESDAQVNFLHTQYNIKKVAGSKETVAPVATAKNNKLSSYDTWKGASSKGKASQTTFAFEDTGEEIYPTKNPACCIWGDMEYVELF